MVQVMRSKKGQVVTLLFVLFVFNVIYFAGLAGFVQSAGIAAINNSDSLWSFFVTNLNLFMIGFDIVAVFAITRFA